MKRRLLTRFNLLVVLTLGGLAVVVTFLFFSSGAATSVQADPSILYAAPGTDCGGMSPCYGSIQAAVDAAASGDEIRVAAGIYTDVNVRPRNDRITTGVVTQAVYVSRTVTIRGGYTTSNWSTSDPMLNPTTLDAQLQGRVLYVTGNISPTIEGLQIANGSAAGLGGHESGIDGGGGVYVATATITIRNCQVVSNTAGQGGGVYLWNSHNALFSGNTVSFNNIQRKGAGVYLFTSRNLIFTDNLVFSNTAQQNGGGLLLYDSDNATIRGNKLVSNTAMWSGGGLFMDSSDAVVSENIVNSNFANSAGGGVFLYASNNVTFSDNAVNFNFANSSGGGLFLISSATTFDRNSILSNTAFSGGGAYLNPGSDATFVNTVFADNLATSQGGGLYIQNSSPRLVHTTIARNRSSDGSGVYVTLTGTTSLTNTILVSC